MRCRNKKVRGQRRKLNALLRQIDRIRVPHRGNEAMEHIHVPGDDWIGLRKTSGAKKTAFCRSWIARTEEITRQTEEYEGFCKVVGLLSYPDLSGSQIIVFYDEGYYNSFWNRKDPDGQTWTPIDNGSFAAKRGIRTELTEIGYSEVIVDEDFVYRDELWFYVKK